MSPKDALVASVQPLASTSYAVSLTSANLNAIGAIDPVGGTATVTAKGTVHGRPTQIAVLQIASDSWAKVNTAGSLGVSPSKWMKLDPTKLGTDMLPFDGTHLTDAFDLSNLLTGVLSVTRNDTQHYSGSIDLTGVQGVSWMIPAGSDLGPAATNVPFTATLDTYGRLIDFRVTGSAVSVAFDFGISDYSAAAPVNRPNDDQVVPAPTGLYALLNAAA